MTAPVVYFDIAGPDAGALRTFYSGLFTWTINEHFAIDTDGLRGTLHQDPAERSSLWAFPTSTKSLPPSTPLAAKRPLRERCHPAS